MKDKILRLEYLDHTVFVCLYRLSLISHVTISKMNLTLSISLRYDVLLEDNVS